MDSIESNSKLEFLIELSKIIEIKKKKVSI